MAIRPPFNALYVFCEAARCNSFKLAAQNLNVTPGAVSRQIQALEESLGQVLFERSPQSLRITRKGQLLFDRVANKIASVQSEVELIRRGGRKFVIRVDAGVTLSMHWLIPRMIQFSEQNPNVQVQISTTDGPIALNKQIDVYIRREVSELRKLPSHRFLEEYSALVGSASILKGKSRLTTREIKKVPRIAASSRPDLWPRWCESYDLDAAEYKATHEFDNTILAIQATSQAMGAMVVPVMFITDTLKSGLLRKLSPELVQTGSYSFAIGAQRNSVHVMRFTRWLGQVS
jgi:LysR family transcriptional regulator, glycine cleavage system transcriptional activator